MIRQMLVACVVLLVPLFAHASQADHIRVEHAWIRLLPGGLPASGYAILDNDDTAPAVLVSAQSPAYASVMLHLSATNHGMSSMRAVEHLTIPAQSHVALAPGGYHLMLLRPAAGGLKPGDTVAITLSFADGSHVSTPFLVRPANTAE